MKHPFDGIIQIQPSQTRRSWMKWAFGALASLVGLQAAEAAAPPIKVRLEPEPSPEPPDDQQPRAVTLAVGEQGGGPLTKARGEAGKNPVFTKGRGEAGGATTKALREEGAMTQAVREGGVSTRALGEEGGAVTKAIPEQGGAVPVPKPPIRVTTLAIGEEGAKKN